MKTLQELIEAARKAVLDGDLELAEKLTNQAKAMKALDGLDPAESEELKTLKTEIAELREFKKRIESEPAHNKAGHVTVTQDETDKKAAIPFKSLGEQLKAIANAYLHPHAMDDRLKAQKATLGANETTAADGGFLVQQDFTQAIMTMAHDTAVISSRCRNIPVGANSNGLKMNAIDESSRANGSRWGGVRGYWLAEGGTITASQPKFRQMSWELKKLGALMYSTDELLADTTALGAVMQQAAGEELAFMLDDSILNGSGAGQPLGVLNSPALVTISKETGQAAATVVYQNIQKMWARMWARSRTNAVWLINQDVEPALNSMDFPVGTGGVPVYLPPGGLSQAPLGTLMSRPVIPTEFNATLGTVGDIVLADFSQYLLVDKGGVQGATSIHVQFLTDQTAFRWIYRVDGQPLWHSALTPYKGSNTLSPFLALATRA
jgi:HK97 family phage major capsid protein